MTVATRTMSKFSLAQLALRAAVELERAQGGGAPEAEPLLEFSAALLHASLADEDDAPFRFVEPGFYQPLQRLYHVQESVRASDIEHIQQLIRRVSEGLARAADGHAADTEALIRFCVALHQELIEEMTAEDALVVHEGRTYGHWAAAGFRPA